MSRLTSYDEDMGLLINEEERLLSSKGFIDKDEMYKIMRHLAEKLKDYEDLEEQGKLLKLPCSVGGDVYGIINQTSNYDGAPYRIVTVLNFRLDMLNKIGKTVFLTRPEAEAKLAEMEGKK